VSRIDDTEQRLAALEAQVFRLAARLDRLTGDRDPKRPIAEVVIERFLDTGNRAMTVAEIAEPGVSPSAVRSCLGSRLAGKLVSAKVAGSLTKYRLTDAYYAEIRSGHEGEGGGEEGGAGVQEGLSD